MSKNSPCQGARILMGKHKQEKLVKPLLVTVTAKKKRQGKGIGSEDVCVWWWCGRGLDFRQGDQGRPSLRSIDHNWGTQISYHPRESWCRSLREMANKDQMWKTLEKMEYWCSSAALNNPGSRNWKERNGTAQTAATGLSRRPGRDALVSEVERNAWWFGFT